MNRRDELKDFRRQCERQLRRPVADRIRFGFFRNPDPVRDAGVNRSFSTMQEYREFCARAYPPHFGYDRADVE
jgi:hypothetical protein